MSDPWVNYTTAGGYDERDGLDDGRWMFDDERRCQVWVHTGAPKPEPKPPTPIRQLLACPTCHARVDQTCRTTGGNRAAPHIGRLAPRLCPCGELAVTNATMCDPCRAETRRATWRAAGERYRTKRDEVAS